VNPQLWPYTSSIIEVIMKREWSEAELSVLRDQTSDEDPVVRREAARRIGNTGDKDSIEYLIKLLEDEDGTVRSYAAGALRIGDVSNSKHLIRALQDEEPQVVNAAISALESCYESDEAIRQVGKFLHHENSNLALSAIYTLRHIGELRTQSGIDNILTIDTLLSAKNHEDRHLRKRVHWALHHCGHDYRFV